MSIYFGTDIGDFKKENLKGTVKQLIEKFIVVVGQSNPMMGDAGFMRRKLSQEGDEKRFTFNTDLNKVETVEIYYESEYCYTYKWIYDSDGSCLLNGVYKEDGSPHWEINSEMNDNSKVQSKVCVEGNNVTWKEEWSYEGDKTIIKTFDSNDNIINKRVLTYKENQIIEESTFSSEGNLLGRCEKSYNNNNNQLLLSSQFKGKVQDGIFEYEFLERYDDNGNLIEDSWYKYGTLRSQTLLTYNQFGDCISVNMPTSDKKYTITYEYDNFNNWILKNTFQMEKHIYTETREIKY